MNAIEIDVITTVALSHLKFTQQRYYWANWECRTVFLKQLFCLYDILKRRKSLLNRGQNFQEIKRNWYKSSKFQTLYANL